MGLISSREDALPWGNKLGVPRSEAVEGVAQSCWPFFDGSCYHPTSTTPE